MYLNEHKNNEMGKGLDKRKRIFEKYSSQLRMVLENEIFSGIELKFPNTYICPICFNQFDESDLLDSSDNMLTLEDAPPKSLGGKANTLTCKQCNSFSGHEIDFHLTERLIEMDIRKMKPNIETDARLMHKGRKVQGKIKVDDKGKITVFHNIKQNNPKIIDEYIKSTGDGDLITIEHKESRVNIRRLEIALLKTAYILAFEQLGYALILNKSFDIVREQLLNPNEDIYPVGFWTKQEIFKGICEIFLIESKGFEGIYSIFPLKTKSTETYFGVYLPINSNKTEDVISNLAKQEAGFSLNFRRLDFDYFENIDNIIGFNKHINTL